MGGMMIGMTAKAKIAVTVPADLVEAARRAVRFGRAASVSAYVTEALRERLQHDDLAGLLEEMLAETGGPMTEAERREIDRMAGWD
jgi:Arc/MetJ-type ribon-helix-helix transcriptional regulator